MEALDPPEPVTREETLARLLRTARPARTVEELYGPGPDPDDPEDLEEFLAVLAANKRPARAPDERVEER